MPRTWRLLALAVVGVGLIYLGWTKLRPGPYDPLVHPPPEAFSTDRRPGSDGLLFDYSGSLGHFEEGTNRFLRRLRERFQIEAMIVTLPALPAHSALETLAVDLVNGWRIGGDFEGRGLLLLLVDNERLVKLEVTYELEDVFTDAFTGYVEDLQLRPYYLADDIGTGLVAVMEELEQRAQLKRQAEYTPGMIAGLDEELLAGGAGARRNLARYETGDAPDPAAVAGTGRGARSPQEAWQIMLAKWEGKGATIDVDVYTEMTRMAMGDPDRPDARTLRAVPHWRDAGYQVLQDRDHAVIWFGNIEGWNNAPFLFCRTPGGWKFDIVHQRRLVVMTENPHWKVEQGNYPYVDLLAKARQSTAKDLPLGPEDLYLCRDDAILARRISELERALQDAPDNADALMSLVRLNVITGRRPNHVHPLLKRLRTLNPGNPAVHKYAAIHHVNSFFQYESALKEMLAYLELVPDDSFAHSFIGFLHYRLGDYDASIGSLEEAIAMQPDNVYAYALLARDYALLHGKTDVDSLKRHYRERALDMLRMAQHAPTPDPARVARLQRWLNRRLQ